MAWNEERIALLRSYYAEGLSMSEIASRLGGVTRNAVIGKATRLGLHRAYHNSPMARINTRPPRRRTPPAPKPVSKAPTFPTAPVPSPAEDDIPTKTLMDLEPGDCRWRVDKPLGSDPYGFCAKETLPGLTFCEGHARRAYANWPEVKHKYVEVKEKAKEAEPA